MPLMPSAMQQTPKQQTKYKPLMIRYYTVLSFQSSFYRSLLTMRPREALETKVDYGYCLVPNDNFPNAVAIAVNRSCCLWYMYFPSTAHGALYVVLSTSMRFITGEYSKPAAARFSLCCHQTYLNDIDDKSIAISHFAKKYTLTYLLYWR